MNVFQFLAADWRLRLLAQLTCAPQPPRRPSADPIAQERRQAG